MKWALLRESWFHNFSWKKVLPSIIRQTFNAKVQHHLPFEEVMWQELINKWVAHLFPFSPLIFLSRHLAEHVDDIYYQRPADNWGLQIKYLASRADERGGRMSKDDVEIVYNGVGMYDIFVNPRENLWSFSLWCQWRGKGASIACSHRSSDKILENCEVHSKVCFLMWLFKFSNIFTFTFTVNQHAQYAIFTWFLSLQTPWKEMPHITHIEMIGLLNFSVEQQATWNFSSHLSWVGAPPPANSREWFWLRAQVSGIKVYQLLASNRKNGDFFQLCTSIPWSSAPVASARRSTWCQRNQRRTRRKYIYEQICRSFLLTKYFAFQDNLQGGLQGGWRWEESSSRGEQ